MGKERVADKAVHPLQTLYNLTPAMAVENRSRGSIGFAPIGYYRGIAAFWDLDKAVVQPLVLAEQQHILGLLDGREANYDLLTLTTVAGEVATAHVGALTVPAGELWFINSVVTTVPANCVANWYCSLWTDRVGALGFGQAAHVAVIAAGVTQQDEFQPAGPVWALTNKTVALRAPAGTVFTCILTSVPVVGLVSCTFQIYGWLGKALVV